MSVVSSTPEEIRKRFQQIHNDLHYLGEEFRLSGDFATQNSLHSLRDYLYHCWHYAESNSSLLTASTSTNQQQYATASPQSQVQQQQYTAQTQANIPNAKVIGQPVNKHQSSSLYREATPAPSSSFPPKNDTPLSIKPINVNTAKKNDFIRVLNKLSDEKDSLRWKAKLKDKGYDVFAIATSNGAVWHTSDSMQGDTMCATQLTNYIFVIPSPTDRSLRSSQISDWFNVKGAGSKYRLDDVAIGKQEISGGYTLHTKGAITRSD